MTAMHVTRLALLCSLIVLGCDPAAVGSKGPREPSAAPVEVTPITQGPIELVRVYSGELEATAQFSVASNVSGRIERLLVDVPDTVTRGQLVAEIDDAEFEQAVSQAEADLAVANATLAEAESALAIARRKLDRSTQIHGRGVLTEADLDLAKADELAANAAVQVARARIKRAEAALAGAQIQIGHTQVRATWNSGDNERVVAERFVDEGDTIDVNQPLLSVIETAPITAVMFVTEFDYGRLQVDQTAELWTDAFTGQTFEGRVVRIAPVFDAASRQARVELEVENADDRLKPGMFVRVRVLLERVPDATIVPAAAIVTREGSPGVFLAVGGQAVWRPVQVGIQQGERVQLLDEGLSGQVITLGQQLIGDGSPITIPAGDDGGVAPTGSDT